MKHFTKASKELRALANTLDKKAITSDSELEKLHTEIPKQPSKEELIEEFTEAMNAAAILDDLADKFGYELCNQIANMCNAPLNDNNTALLAHGLSVMRYKSDPDDLYTELFD